jgi:hypothetical protein
MAILPHGLRLRQRLAVSARSRPAELSPNLQRYADTGEALVGEPFRGITVDGAVVHPFVMRHGVPLDELSPAQRDRALALLRESLSAEGVQTARDVMRLNELVRALTGSGVEYGEWLYWLSVMGTPSPDEPWGWQIDGHHLIVNCFVLGDQLVMTPMFMGSEPVAAADGPLTGTRVFAAEEQQGLHHARFDHSRADHRH